MKRLNLAISLFILLPLLKCATECESCGDGTNKCKDSIDGYYMYSFSSDKICYKCSSICATCTSYSNCQSCISGYNLNSNSNCCYECNYNCKTTINNCECTSCNDGYYLSCNECYKCNSICKTCSSYSSNCLTCNPGYFYYGNYCYKCNMNCKTTSDDCKCDSCSDGYYLSIFRC